MWFLGPDNFFLKFENWWLGSEGLLIELVAGGNLPILLGSQAGGLFCVTFGKGSYPHLGQFNEKKDHNMFQMLFVWS